MPVTPTGPQGISLSKLADLVATSGGGLATRLSTYAAGTLPADRIHWPWVDADQLANLPRPCCVLWQDDEPGSFGWTKIAGGASNALLPFGTLKLLLLDSRRFQDQREADADFKNFVDAVLLDVATGAGVDDELDLHTIVQEHAPTFEAPENLGGDSEMIWACYLVLWGASR